MVPGEIEGVGERKNREGSEKGATKEIHRTRTSGQVGVGHGVSLQAKGKKWDSDKGG